MNQIGPPLDDIKAYIENLLQKLGKNHGIKPDTIGERVFFNCPEDVEVRIDDEPFEFHPHVIRIFIWKSMFRILVCKALKNTHQMCILYLQPIMDGDIVSKPIAAVSFVNHREKGMFQNFITLLQDAYGTFPEVESQLTTVAKFCRMFRKA